MYSDNLPPETEWPADTILAITVPRLKGWKIFDLKLALTLSRDWVYYRDDEWKDISERGARKIVNIACKNKLETLLNIEKGDDQS